MIVINTWFWIRESLLALAEANFPTIFSISSVIIGCRTTTNHCYVNSTIFGFASRSSRVCRTTFGCSIARQGKTRQDKAKHSFVLVGLSPIACLLSLKREGTIPHGSPT